MITIKKSNFLIGVLLACLLIAGAYTWGKSENKSESRPKAQAAFTSGPKATGNDAGMIQQAIDEAAVSKSGSVKLAAHKTYNLKSGIVIKEGVQLKLGIGTKLAVHGDFRAVQLERNAAFVNGTIEVTSPSFSSEVIYLKGNELYEAVNETFIQNVRIVNSSGKPSGTGLSLYAKGTWHNISFVNISDVTISGFQTGIQLEARKPARKNTYSWINANRFTNLSMEDCVTFIRIKGTKNVPNESSGNLFTGLQIQLTENTKKIIEADGSYNKFEGMVWDQHRVQYKGPLVWFSKQTEYNKVEMNIRRKKVKDEGEANQIY